nr:uncharacterized protein LOC124805837 [Hydra vulgaris]
MVKQELHLVEFIPYCDAVGAKSFPINDQNEIVEILNKQFQDVFTIENSTEELPQIENLGDIIIDAVNIDYFDVLSRLKHVDINKTYGVDSIHLLILKNCADSLASPLTLIFKESFVKNELPTQLRAANITTLFKKGDKLEAANYRPLSLTSITCKFMEGKSCTTNLLEALDYISFNLSIGISVDVALLDFVKAFVSVAH